MPQHKIAMLTAGGLAPCLSSAVGGLIECYTELAPDAEIIGYLSGYKGLLKGHSLKVTPEVRAKAHILHRHGGSPLGNSRIKLTNVADCVRRGLVKEGEVPLEVAASQLTRDGITILHTIGGDDTNTTAADLAAYLAKHNYKLTVVGLPKTIDNDIVPIQQSLGALTAAEQGAIYFENVVNEQSAHPRMLMIHEIMGRNCGWLTAATAEAYRKRVRELEFIAEFNLDLPHKDVDAVYVPELAIDLEEEAERLRIVMDQKDCVNIFLSEGAGVRDVVAEMLSRGETPDTDAFGHVKIDKINVGEWFARRFAKLIGAERTLVQKSGYFARSAAANPADLKLIRSMVHHAVESGLRGESGVVGQDDAQGGALRTIEFPRIKGGKNFDAGVPWFAKLLKDIGQPVGETVASSHGHDD